MQLEKAFYAFFRVTIHVWVRVKAHFLFVTAHSLVLLRLPIFFLVSIMNRKISIKQP